MSDLDHIDSLNVLNRKYRKFFGQESPSLLDMAAIQKINKLANEKIKLLEGEPGDIIFFKEVIEYGFYYINRLNKGKLYYQSSNIPIEWSCINGSVIMKALKQIIDDDFYVYRKIDIDGGGHQYAKTWLNGKRKFSSTEGN